MASNLYYLSRTNGASKIYFNINPTPLPDIEPGMRVISKELMPGLDASGNPTDAGRIFYKIGSHITRQDLQITIPFATAATRTGIITLFNLSDATIYYSPDNGTNVYEVCFADGKPFTYKRQVGVSDIWEITLSFYIVSKPV